MGAVYLPARLRPRVAWGILCPFTLLRIALAVIGAASSLYHPAGMAIISRNVKEAGSALGTNGIWGNFGIALAPFVAGALAAWQGWRLAYSASAGILFLVAIFVLFIRPQDDVVRDTKDAPVKDEQAPKALPLPVWMMLLYAGAMACAGLGYRSVSISMPAFFEDRSSALLNVLNDFQAYIPLESNKTLAATFITSLAYFVGMAGQAFGGKVADRFDLRKAYILFHSSSLPFLLLCFCLKEEFLPFAVAGYIFFAMGMQPIENSLVARLSVPRYRGLFYGLKFTLTFGVGSLAVYPVAFIEKHFSLETVFAFTAGTAFLTAVFGLIFYFVTGSFSERFYKGGTVKS
ncbi:MAG: MFS transporter [Planctomycetota bacterium]|nr:MFS transporter [Planctomycetota bacterium]